jgi:hypothetical protein
MSSEKGGYRKEVPFNVDNPTEARQWVDDIAKEGVKTVFKGKRVHLHIRPIKLFAVQERLLESY